MSTARTNVGCMAEDHAADMAVICEEWASTERNYHQRHPHEMTEDNQRRIDVAESFVLAVRRARPSEPTAAEGRHES